MSSTKILSVETLQWHWAFDWLSVRVLKANQNWAENLDLSIIYVIFMVVDICMLHCNARWTRTNLAHLSIYFGYFFRYWKFVRREPTQPKQLVAAILHSSSSKVSNKFIARDTTPMVQKPLIWKLLWLCHLIVRLFEVFLLHWILLGFQSCSVSHLV